MGSPTDSMAGGPAPKAVHALRVVLRDGFRGHSIVIAVNGRTVLHAAEITTDPHTGRAATIVTSATAGTSRLAVSVTPGNLVAEFDVDLIARPYVAISLVGEGTIALETSTISLL
jgi:hypothetical protein